MGWVVVNILLPAFAPIALMMLFFRPLKKRFSPQAQRLINALSPIKDGQLSWAGLAFCAAGLYELHEATDAVRILGNNMHGLAEFLFIAGLLVNAVMAAEGAVFPAELPRSPDIPFNEQFPVLRNSLLFTALSGILFAVVHFFLVPQGIT